jgi:predicted esterase
MSLSFTHRFVQATSDRTLILFHGTGGNEDSLLDIGHELDPHANLLSPRGKVLENGMPRFFRRLREGIIDEQDIAIQSQDLSNFIAEACKEYSLNTEKLCAVGYSNGANIAASILLLHPKSFTHAVLLRSMLPLTPVTPPNLIDHHILMLSGEHDTMVKQSQVTDLQAIFISAGADTVLTWRPTGHSLDMGDIFATKEWVQNTLL